MAALPKFHSILRSVDQAGDDVARAISLWLFGDLVYAVLPILVLATITWLLQEPFEHFLELKEWSFATIVLYGVQIKNFVRLKVQIQQSPGSYKLASGMQIHILLLIVSVLLLALVVLAEKRVIPEAVLQRLGPAQLALFVLAVMALFVGTLAEDAGLKWAGYMAQRLHPMLFLKRGLRELQRAEGILQYVVYAVERQGDIVLKADYDTSGTANRAAFLRRISLTLDEIEEATKYLRGHLRGDEVERVADQEAASNVAPMRPQPDPPPSQSVA